MVRLLFLGITLLLGTSLFNSTNAMTKTPPPNEPQPPQQTQKTGKNDENAVRNLVEEFGKKLQMVSLMATPELVSQSLKENYSHFISPALLAKWQKEPQSAPGRMVSSPWPDRIEITSMEKASKILYKVTGTIIEVTSTEKGNGGFTAKRPVILMVKRIEERWLIDGVMLGAYEIQPVAYKNLQYGLEFSLPNSWQGYTIVTDQWKGNAIGENRIAETGPMLSIRHPQWTAQNPRQDIPILIFTHSQWNHLQQDKFHIGAAPINPSELGRNNKFVFALPARYNFAFPTGYEEVEQILKSKPLKAI